MVGPCVGMAFKHLGPFGAVLGPLELLFGPSWALLGRYWEALGPSWGALGPSWRSWEAPWGALGPSRAVLGGSRGTLGGLGGAPGAPWGGPKSIKKSIRKSIRNRVGSGSAKMAQTLRLPMSQKGRNPNGYHIRAPPKTIYPPKDLISTPLLTSCLVALIMPQHLGSKCGRTVSFSTEWSGLQNGRTLCGDGL